MQGSREHQPELFAYIDLESFIPQNHVLRKIDKAIDLGFIRAATAPYYCQDNGRPSIDPEIFFRMTILQCFYNIASDRQLSEEVQYNLAYRWFCKLNLSASVPDHSSLSKIRDRLGLDVFKTIFEEVVEICKRHGLVKSEVIMADGSLIKANASLNSLSEVNDDGTFKDVGDADASYNEYGVKERTISNKTHTSKTDADAKLAASKRYDANALRYKAHYIVDQESRVILDALATSGNVSEVEVVLSRVQELKDKGFSLKKIIADRGYGSGENIESLQGQGLQTSIPLRTTKVGKHDGRNDNFKVDHKNLKATCPKGFEMNRLKDEESYKRFRLPKEVCGNCDLFKTCIPENKGNQFRGRLLRIPQYQEIYDQVLLQEKTDGFKQDLRERMHKIESLFAEAKLFHGLGRARMRGLPKMQMQLYVVATIQNIKRVLNVMPFFPIPMDEISSKISSVLRIMKIILFLFKK